MVNMHPWRCHECKEPVDLESPKTCKCYREIWVCTSCTFKREKKEFLPVMYRGTDWRICPSCSKIAIPYKGEQ